MKNNKIFVLFFVTIFIMMTGCSKGNKDKQPPVIETKLLEIWLGNTIDWENEIICTDDSGETPTVNFVSELPDLKEAGRYSVKVEAKDSAGNVSQATVAINVKGYDSSENCMNLIEEALKDTGNEDMDCHINNSDDVIASLGYLSTKSCGGDSVRISSFISVSPTSKSLYANFNFTMEKKVVDKWITAAMEDAKVVFSGAGEKFTIESALNCGIGYSDEDFAKLRKMINSGDLTITKTGWGEKMNFDTYKNERVNYNYVYKCDDSDMEKLQKMLKVYETILAKAGITID